MITLTRLGRERQLSEGHDPAMPKGVGSFDPVDIGRAQGQTDPVSQEALKRSMNDPTCKFQPFCSNPVIAVPHCFLDTDTEHGIGVSK
jgi:hypothetical protein